MERLPLVCGNWKMNRGVAGEALELVEALMPRLLSLEGVEVAVAPPFVALSAVAKRLQGTSVALAAQNVHEESHGAFTGEVAPGMLSDLGVRYVIVGHSERRTLLGETDEGTRRKVAAVHAAGMRAILCVGETLEEREQGRTLEVVTRQLEAGFSGVSGADVAAQVVAYEPVWAIGTGKTATAEQAQDVHAHLRGVLSRAYGSAVGDQVRIQYGGSVKPGNAGTLFSQPDIDGGLIGGASLKAEDFAAICAARPT